MNLPFRALTRQNVLMLPELRVLLVDDHRTFSGALRVLLDGEDGIEVVDAVPSVTAGRAAVASLEPDVLVVDLDLAGEDGLELVRDLNDGDGSDDGRTLPTLVLTCHEDAASAIAAFRSGAVAFVPKTTDASTLTSAIRCVAQGKGWLAPEFVRPVMDELIGAAHGRDPQRQRLAKLTDREREILGCLMEGKNRTDIAEDLGVAVNTVRTHVRNLLTKLDAHSTLEAVTLAHRERFDPRADAPSAHAPH